MLLSHMDVIHHRPSCRAAGEIMFGRSPKNGLMFECNMLHPTEKHIVLLK